MPLSKARMRERKRQDRLSVKPMSNLNTPEGVKPQAMVHGSILFGVQPLPNYPDGRYRAYSKEEQLGKKQTKKIIALGELRTKYDYRNRINQHNNRSRP